MLTVINTVKNFIGSIVFKIVCFVLEKPELLYRFIVLGYIFILAVIFFFALTNPIITAPEPVNNWSSSNVLTGVMDPIQAQNLVYSKDKILIAKNNIGYSSSLYASFGDMSYKVRGYSDLYNISINNSSKRIVTDHIQTLGQIAVEHSKEISNFTEKCIDHARMVKADDLVSSAPSENTLENLKELSKNAKEEAAKIVKIEIDCQLNNYHNMIGILVAGLVLVFIVPNVAPAILAAL